MKSTLSEIAQLERISKWYSNKNWGFYTTLVAMGFQTIQPYFRSGNVLEVGSADGAMTSLLVKEFSDITVVDAASDYIDKVKHIDKKIKAYVSLIEEFETSVTFDNVILAHVLEHVPSPRKVLRKLGSLLKARGRLFIIVPNAQSLHRQVGVKIGLIKKTTDLNEADLSVDHKRVYTPRTLVREIERSGLKVIKVEGIFLKPLSNQQINDQWNEALIQGYFQLGKDYPEIASEIAVVCTNGITKG